MENSRTGVQRYLPPSKRLAQYITLNPCRIPLRASLARVDQVIEMVSGDVATAWTFSGGELGTENTASLNLVVNFCTNFIYIVYIYKNNALFRFPG